VPQSIQTKLLRVLESREVMRVGGTATTPINVRLITASKVNLRELVNRNLFRADLFYRINVFPVEIPALRERREDIPILVEHFLDRFAPGKKLAVTREAQRAFVNYSWPGNVRELRNITQRIALFADAEISMKDLPPELHNGNPIALLVKACSQCFVDDSLSFNQIVTCLETNLLRQAMKESSASISRPFATS
jgi:DNA-binding NtrC family response regulator